MKQVLPFVLLVLFTLSLRGFAAEKNDRLDIAGGAVLLSASSEYNQKWAGMLLLDGSTETGWCSAKGNPHPNTFVIELAGTVALGSFFIDNTKAQESGYPGISARQFKLYSSTVSAKEGFQLILEGEAAKGTRKKFTIENPTPGRWLKLEVLSNWGNSQYTELMELEAYGEPSGKSGIGKPVNGVYDTNYGLMWLKQNEKEVEGCYDWDSGRLSGTTDGRVIRFQWTEEGPQTGSAIMVLTTDGGFLNGLWYENGRYQGLWYGKRVTDGRQPKCRGVLEADPESDAIGRALDATGRAIVYGIRFDFDKATIRPDSRETLNRLLKAIEARPDAGLVIEGHTDAEGSDAYNLTLSENRARSVVNWLVAHGVSSGRLTAKGFGESLPVADNARPDGRALNRRVEITVAK